jgi:hypothetical protein
VLALKPVVIVKVLTATLVVIDDPAIGKNVALVDVSNA